MSERVRTCVGGLWSGTSLTQSVSRWLASVSQLLQTETPSSRCEAAARRPAAQLPGSLSERPPPSPDGSVLGTLRASGGPADGCLWQSSC